MDLGERELKLQEDIAAIQLVDRADEDAAGVAVIIPAGQTIRFDPVAPVVGKMRKIEWKGSKFGVFLDDLLERTGKARRAPTSRRAG